MKNHFKIKQVNVNKNLWLLDMNKLEIKDLQNKQNTEIQSFVCINITKRKK